MPRLTAPQILRILGRLEKILEDNKVPRPASTAATPAYLSKQLQGRTPPAWSDTIFDGFIDEVNDEFSTELDADQKTANVTIGNVLQAIVNEKEGQKAPYWP